MLQQGYLLTADVTGYTSFLTGTEIEHAHAVIEDLTSVILRHVQRPFRACRFRFRSARRDRDATVSRPLYSY